ncbi:hypothetical protein FV226_25985 [Methylobacterium sp. WL12]|uniref:hypothetical protein n=1 Tax=Methylobacterium sp. WL12 TaxID=2603890 RepID=UPI0011C8467B|nr:hypothetical protein [Methylobacterium sp. WL12]TXM64797.1 hypothetical protein FV226_25985 [Methylobacterium sp. WL12]
MIVLALAALFGGLATAAWMTDYGVIAVVLTMPLGGSLAALAATIPMAIRNEATRREREALTLPELGRVDGLVTTGFPSRRIDDS